MSMVRTRLEKLEKQMGGVNGPGLLVVVRSGPDEAEVDALLAENGIDADDPRNQIVILRTTLLDRDGGLDPNQVKAEILSIRERK